MWTAELVGWVRERALAEGFDLAGVAEAPAASEESGRGTAERFTDWVEGGRAGEMEYLKRRDGAGELLRTSARVAMPWVRSVVVCAMNYNGVGPLSIEHAGTGAGWIGRYAWIGDEAGGAADYHEVLMGPLRAVEAGLRERVACETRCYVDTGPVLERDFAARAGVGWVGKNTCVLNQELGSWLLLGVIVTSIPVAAVVTVAAADRCGSCTRCIDACPTGALVGAREMDASRCIAYLTIEKKGSIAEELREGMGRQVFGCDICQDVCPWNRRAPVSGLPMRPELVNPGLEWLAGLDVEGFRREFKGSPLERTKRGRVLRNVAIAMGNSGEERFVPRLEEWAAGEDGVLAESAAWALGRLRGASDKVEDERSSGEPTHRVRQRRDEWGTQSDGSTLGAGGWEMTTETKENAAEIPLEYVKPVVRADGWWPSTKALLTYMAQTEVHTYAFSVAANVILSLFPFIVMMITLALRVFHSQAMVDVLGDFMSTLLPSNQDFVMRNMRALASAHNGTKVFSVVMLLVSSTGVFLPLEVALNSVWGVKKNRNYLANQAVSLGLAAAVGVLVMASVGLTAGQRHLMAWVFFGHTNNIVFNLVTGAVLRFFGVIASILLFFLIYWVLPNRKVPAMAVLPTAVVIGLLWEVAKYLYVLVLPRLDFGSVYGPFRVSVGLMMWAFLSGLLLLAGANFSATRYTLRLAREAEAENAE